MKKLALWLGLTVILAFSIGLVSAAPGARAQGNAPRKPVANAIKDAEAVTITGTVELLKGQGDKPGATGPRPLAGSVFLLVKDGERTPVNGAPPPYLQKLGVTLKDGLAITVAGWQQGRGGKDIILARELTIGEKKYELRDENGKPLWLDEMRAALQTKAGDISASLAKAEVVTIDGTVALPKLPKNRPMPLVRFALEKGDTKTQVAAGLAKGLEALGLTIADGDTLMVKGWKLTEGELTYILAKEITKDGKTYVLRDDAGKPAWAPAKPKGGGKVK